MSFNLESDDSNHSALREPHGAKSSNTHGRRAHDILARKHAPRSGQQHYLTKCTLGKAQPPLSFSFSFHAVD